jgi:ribonuclease P protein subunit POP4
MIMTAENVHAHEIIGLDVKIIDSSDPTLNQLTGKVIFETRNTILIRTNSTIKQIAKKTLKKIEIQTRSAVYFISGSSMIGRPEDRISRLN